MIILSNLCGFTETAHKRWIRENPVEHFRKVPFFIWIANGENNTLFPKIFSRAAGAFVFIVLTACSATLWAQSISDDTCMMCHSRKVASIPFVDREEAKNSVHGRFPCMSCHRDADSVPHAKILAPVACMRCHPTQTRDYLSSGHGQALKQDRTIAETCADCHNSPHSIVGAGDPASPVYRGNIVNACARCHADPDRMAAVRLSVKDPVNSYRQTVHGQAFLEGNADSAVCTDCHGTHSLFNALDTRSRIFRKNIPDTCSRCHGEIAEVYKESVHGQAALQGVQESPICSDCHAVHSPGEPAMPATAGTVSRTCSECHESEAIIRKFDLPADRFITYSNSYHGLAARRGDLSVANCASCHGYHDVLPSDDPRSSIHKSNLAETCGKCHPGAGEALSLGNIHGSPESKHWLLLAVQWFYWIVIPVSLGAMLLHNGLDWLRKLQTGVPTATHSDDMRFTVNERWQHFILVSTFALLALSGFALKFPDALWADYLSPSDEAVRKSLHRWAALVFTLLSIYHGFYIGLTGRGRFIIKEMIPRWDDLKDMFRVLAYNLHLRKNPPKHAGFYRYPEKIEYWSLVWGSVLMIVTGSILVFTEFSLKHFPLWVSDLATMAHFYEAILACLAIVIWHFYAVIFDPDVYPMNCSWWNGRVRCSSKDRKDHFRRIPYGRF